MSRIIIALIAILICGCSEEEKSKESSVPNKVESNDINKSVTTDHQINDYVQYIDSLEATNNLISEDYPDMTAWGGLTSKYFNDNLVLINAKHNAELGYIQRVYYIQDSQIKKVIFFSHSAEWEKYSKDKDGDDDFETMKREMTYNDSKLEFEVGQNGSALLNSIMPQGDTIMISGLLSDGTEILDFIKPNSR